MEDFYQGGDPPSIDPSIEGLIIETEPLSDHVRELL